MVYIKADIKTCINVVCPKYQNDCFVVDKFAGNLMISDSNYEKEEVQVASKQIIEGCPHNNIKVVRNNG